VGIAPKLRSAAGMGMVRWAQRQACTYPRPVARLNSAGLDQIVYISRSAETVELWQRVEVVALTSEPRWAFGAGVGNGNASVLSRASMVDEPSTLKIELIYWPATTYAARAEAQAALFRYIDGWQKPRRIQQELVGRSPDEFEAAWQARRRQPARLPSNARATKSPARQDKSPGNRGRCMRAW
jgi:hypothetical protein